MSNGNVPQTVELHVLRADDVIEVGIVQAQAGGERLVTFQIKRLEVGFAMSLGDTAVAANALAKAAQAVLDMNQADADSSVSPIIVARH